MNVRVLRGRNVLAELGSALDDLHQETGVPIVSRRPWLESWIAHYLDHQPWAVAVEGPSMRLEAVALLACRRRRGVPEVVRMGHGASDYGRLPARDPASAACLAQAVVAQLHAFRGPWSLHLGQLPVDDPVARGIAGHLLWANITAGDVSPVLRFGPDRSLRAYISRNHRKNTRLAINRVRKAGLTMAIECLQDPGEIGRALAEATRVRRQRDTAAGRPNKLDDPRYAAFREAVILKLAARGEIEFTTMRVGGDLVAYNVALLDGHACRLWDGRFAPPWSHYYPGQLVINAVLERTLTNPRFTEIDLMRGGLHYKERLANELVAAQTLVAWSSPIVQTVFGWTGLLKAIRDLRKPAARSRPGQVAAAQDGEHEEEVA